MPIAPAPIPEITTPVPLSTDPDNFEARADQAWTELPESIEGMNAAGLVTFNNATEVFERAVEIEAAALVAVDAAGLVGRSSAPLVVGAGVKPVSLLEAKPKLAVLNKRVVILQNSDPTIRMFGTISSVTSSSAFAVTVVSSGAFGSGNFSSWQIIDAAFFGAAATAIEVWTANQAASLAPTSLYGATESQPFIEPGAAGTFTFDGNAGWSFHTTIAGTGKTVGAPTNFKPGQSGRIRFVVQAGAGPLAFSTVWKFSFGPPVTASTNGLVFVISYYVHDASNIEAVYIPNMQA
ncbi:hypothetical protein [Phenylobacterium sp.]|uniref:hypothetical protein n=1 Tax=Phenylobacterium sp. TaxID=1871053 RepID=UPI00273148F5|nr:hypothetical protein [Phenylobacterium sp.]MDP1599025.1 hypothetical protein [Phenylobacterium sp.]MDP3590453.1 hypothetical protein [Phenylobacterium sp.]